MKKSNQIISLIILFVIGFVFLHSELDLFSPDQHSHISHDFCDIVDNARLENSTFVKFKINSIDVPIILFSASLNLTNNLFASVINNSKKPKPDINLNVLYGSFLI